MPPKDKRFASHGGRYGPGKVHRYVYDSLNKLWHLSCRDVAALDPYGEVVDSLTAVTCKRCL